MGFHKMCYSLTLYTHACTHTHTHTKQQQQKQKRRKEVDNVQVHRKIHQSTLRPDSLHLIPNLVNLYLRSNSQAPGLTAIRTTLENQDLCRNNSQIISTETGSILLMIS